MQVIKNLIRDCLLKAERASFSLLSRVSPKKASLRRYKSLLGEKCNLDNPKKFNEKLMKLKLDTYYNNDLITTCCDKYLVRDYLKKLGCEEILNQLLFVCDSPSEIPWDKLPSKYVIKCNHGCNYNIICTDSKTVDKKAVSKKINKWLKEKYWLKAAETNYKFIKPKIIIEKYIETDAGTFPIDYRFYCSKGSVKACLLMHYSDEGYERHNSYHIYVDKNYNPMDIGDSINQSDQLPPKPSNFDEMWKYAEVLSKAFPFVRVDLYSCDGKTIFGELTFSPCGCTGLYNISPTLDSMFSNIDTLKIDD